MPRRMSCSLTVEAVRERRKTVTRRDATTWRMLKPGDRLTLIEKGMGLPAGARQVVLAEVLITDVRVELLTEILYEPHGVEREGFALTPRKFVEFWCRSHGKPADDPLVACRRIEWVYLDDATIPTTPNTPSSPDRANT